MSKIPWTFWVNSLWVWTAAEAEVDDELSAYNFVARSAVFAIPWIFVVSELCVETIEST